LHNNEADGGYLPSESGTLYKICFSKGPKAKGFEVMEFVLIKILITRSAWGLELHDRGLRCNN